MIRILLVLAWFVEKLIDRFAPARSAHMFDQPVGEWMDPELLRPNAPAG